MKLKKITNYVSKLFFIIEKATGTFVKNVDISRTQGVSHMIYFESSLIKV